jgi:signal transduction histidine kinase
VTKEKMDELTEQQKRRMIEAGQAALHMSHAVKNLLQAIHSSRDVMDKALETKDIERANRAWGILKDSLGRIEKLTLDTLKYSREDELNFESCDLNKLIDSVIQTVQSQADKRNIQLSAELDSSIGQILIDSEQMRDTAMNLLLNAIEAVQDNTGEIFVQTELNNDGKQVILTIKDNGSGLEDADRIFQPFYSTKSNIGTGLGLAIVQKIVQNHSGTIDVKSVPNEGTIFAVQIPVNGNISL